MIDDALQLVILASAAAAIWLVTDVNSPRRRALGCAIGLAGQPFWLYATWQSGQWGIFLLALWYAYAYARGLRAARRPHAPHNSAAWLRRFEPHERAALESEKRATARKP